MRGGRQAACPIKRIVKRHFCSSRRRRLFSPHPALTYTLPLLHNRSNVTSSESARLVETQPGRYNRRLQLGLKHKNGTPTKHFLASHCSRCSRRLDSPMEARRKAAGLASPTVCAWLCAGSPLTRDFSHRRSARYDASRRSLGSLPQNTEEHHAERGIGSYAAARAPARALAGVVLSANPLARRYRS